MEAPVFRPGRDRIAKPSAPLRFVWSWPHIDITALDPATAVVAREPDGRWYVSFAVETSEPAPLPETGRKVWQKPHLANATGTPTSYRPPGHDYEGGHRARATGDYEAWTPS